jgi:putative nucleotidyltransferase with HDIG domain
MNESLQKYVRNIEKIPTLPVIAQEILSFVNNDTVSVGKIERVVENDPAISAKILSVANSAYFGVKARTNTLDSAIMRIGFGNVKSIALGISLMTVLQEGSGNVFDYRRIYNHSVTVGFVARLFSKKLKLDFADDILTGGILHDLGYLVLNRYFPDIYKTVIGSFNTEGSLLAAEEKILDFNHAEIGHWLAEQWKLPSHVLDVVRYHHEPSHAKRSVKRAAVIHIADFITTKYIMSPTVKDPNYPFDSSSLDTLSITQEDLRAFQEEMHSEGRSAELL